MRTNLQELSSSDLWKVIDLTNELLDLADTIVPGKSFFRGHMLLERCRAAAELITRHHRTDKDSKNVPLLNVDNKTFLYFPVPEDNHQNVENKLPTNNTNNIDQENKVKNCKENTAEHLSENYRKLDLKVLLAQAKEGRDTMQYAKRMPLEAYLVVMFLEKILGEPHDY